MTNESAWNIYKEYTSDITLYSRKIAFANGGICWLLKDVNTSFPQEIRTALIFLVLFFLFDIMQGLIASFIRKYLIRKQEKDFWEMNKSLEGEYLFPGWVDTPAFTLFIMKIASLLISYLFIILYLF